MSDLEPSPDNNFYPVLPLRDIVVFPHMIVPLFVGRDKSVNALENVMQDDKEILLITQKEAGVDDPGPDDIYEIGTIGNILQLLKLPDGTVKVLVEGVRRVKIEKYTKEDDYLEAEVKTIEPESEDDDTETQALAKAAATQFEQYVKLNKKIPPEVIVSVNQIEEPSKMADTIASHLALKIDEKQKLLEIPTVAERLEQIFGYMEGEIGVLQVEKRIRNRVKRQMEKTQREYYLNEQMKAIQKELGESEEGLDELGELEKKIEETKLSKEAEEKAKTELKKLRQMSPMSAEATVIRNYLDWILSIPWKQRSRVKKDIKAAKKVLDKDHYGLEKVKERILEYLAVQNRTRKVKGPILCLVGPPGVGKTSLAKSIARSTGRPYVRMALGGVRDEAEIRGHRRTYIGALPGKIVQGMRKAEAKNPLFLLDEVDKLGADFRGDPSSALLEVLDPAQNHTFQDHFLEVDFDLSDVMFICTSNSYNIPPALRDRMEIIRLSGYTEDEKVAIARKHLLRRNMKENGLKKGELEVDDNAIREIIRYYTREAGVRNLERSIASLCRKAVKKIISEKKRAKKEKKKAKDITPLKITKKNIGDYLGVKQFSFGIKEKENQVGVVTGLAYTEFGGDLLPIEATVLDGKGKMILTGKLGDVMQESISAANSYVRSRWADFGLQNDYYQNYDIHIHVPDTATPKDGPSAGIAMVTAMVSALTGTPIKSEVAMTGEVSLRGNVMPIGGLKEKLLSALRGGIKTVVIPDENKKDLEDIPDHVKEALKIIPAKHIDEVLKVALVSLPKAVKNKPTTPLTALETDSKGKEKPVTAH